GVLLENNGLYDRLSAFENLDYYARLYGLNKPEKRIAEMLEFTGLLERRDDAVGTFSAGMKRKLGIARAIIHDPEILFLDEPTSGLDPEAQVLVRDLILRLSQQESMTVFMSSHNLDEVEKVCSKVAILHAGTIQAFDTVQNLRSESGRAEVEITPGDRGQIDAAISILKAMPEVSETWSRDGKILVALARGSPAAPLLTSLIGKGIAVEEAKKVSRSLEEIYLGVMQQTEGTA
ncbi:MAG TPA: ABC transporter ATP-binding protein, partial [Methanomicrobiales archaeon]|nr:ABC transporter ATP-binding protein [Methanomicrobiales archaeon]